MAMTNEKFSLQWKDHAHNFSIAFNNILEQKELVDVTLAAEGHLFGVHRLILAAISPYFRQMFTQMPANQHAFVFMKDVSKHTLEHLITFIYSGEVNVDQSGLEEFINIAKSIEIKGLTDANITQSSELNWSMPKHINSQYQSSRTVQVATAAYSNSALSQSHYYQTSDEFQQQIDLEIEDAEGRMAETENEMGNDYGDDYNNHSYIMNNDGSSMDQYFDVPVNQWDSHYYDNGTDKKQTDSIAPKVKRTKRTQDINEFNIIADIRKNASGRDNLFYNGYKFTKNGKGARRQAWQCSKQSSEHCKVSACTIEMNGVVMMKVSKIEHSHQPNLKT